MAFLFLLLFIANSQKAARPEKCNAMEKEALNYTQLLKMLEVPPCISNVFITLVMISDTGKVNN